MNRPRHFDQARFEELLSANSVRLGRPLVISDLTSSTNDDALLAARAGTAHGALFLAEEQTEGRGRRGSRWLSAAHQNLTFSLVLRPNWTPARCQGLSLAVGLAVRDVVQSAVEVSVQIKWPNDVVADMKKIGGVLVETQLAGAVVHTVIIGIGLNVLSTDFPVAIRNSATSLCLLGAKQLEREKLLAELLAALEVRLEVFDREGLPSSLGELGSYDALHGRAVTVDGLRGIACGIDQRGALLLQDETGHVHALNAGHVEVVPD